MSENEALERMTALDDELEAAHPGWMTGTPPATDAEPVAWLYVCIKPVGDRQHLDPTITSAHRLNLDPTHWTETPLHTADQLQAHGDARAREGYEQAMAERLTKLGPRLLLWCLK